MIFFNDNPDKIPYVGQTVYYHDGEGRASFRITNIDNIHSSIKSSFNATCIKSSVPYINYKEDYNILSDTFDYYEKYSFKEQVNMFPEMGLS